MPNGAGTTPRMNQRPVRAVIAEAVARLTTAGVDTPRLDARILLAHALGVRSVELITIEEIGETQQQEFEALLARRVAREPVAYISGLKEFFSLDFEIGPGALIPRPETETLIEAAIREFPDRDADLNVLDLGTGSGCLIISFLDRYRRATGVAVDASGEALVWASRNGAKHGISGRCEFAQGGWRVDGSFDVVFANPPYLTDEEFAVTAPEIRIYEPARAFAAGSDGLASYRELAPELAGILKPEGCAFIEVGAGQAPSVSAILGESGLELASVTPDLSGIPRCIVVRRFG